MKTRFPLFFLLQLLVFPLFALDFGTNASRYDHLLEINQVWGNQASPSPGGEYIHFDSDHARIQMHLQWVEAALRARDLSMLSAVARANRLRHLERLNAYWRAGQFPTNQYHAHRQPYFRGSYGVLCAVGYLLWQDGQHELVERINRKNNYAYVAELARQYPDIEAWGRVNGFTVAELAWIQPTYYPAKPQLSNWGNGGGLNAGGRINTMTKTGAETLLFVGGSFSEIDGLAANSIAVWNGSTWSALGEGVVGEIFALAYYQSWNVEKLFVAGNFHLPDQPDQRNMAEYDLLTQTWKGLQTGDMQGSIYTMFNSYGTCYVGGDFQRVNGLPSPNLAIYNDYYEAWNHWSNWAGFRTDGPVYALEKVGDLFLVGGSFQKVYQSVDSTWLDAPHLAYYDGDGWLPLPHTLPPVRSLAYFQGNVYTGHQFEESGSSTGIHILKGGLWFEHSCFEMGDNTIYGFTEREEGALVAYGGFSAGWTIVGRGANVFLDDGIYSRGYLMSDSTVRAMLAFQDHLYMAGDFQYLFDDPYPGLARSLLPTTPTYTPAPALPIEIIAQGSQLALRYEELLQATQLTIYDLHGRLLAQRTLALGAGEATIHADNWASGLYVWHLQNIKGAQTGKWVVAY